LAQACEAATIELRGESDVSLAACSAMSVTALLSLHQVYDHFAEGDAQALVRFLVGRGYLSSQALAMLAEKEAGVGIVPKALPLSGVDMIEVTEWVHLMPWLLMGGSG